MIVVICFAVFAADLDGCNRENPRRADVGWSVLILACYTVGEGVSIFFEWLKMYEYVSNSKFCKSTHYVHVRSLSIHERSPKRHFHF